MSTQPALRPLSEELNNVETQPWFTGEYRQPTFSSPTPANHIPPVHGPVVSPSSSAAGTLNIPTGPYSVPHRATRDALYQYPQRDHPLARPESAATAPAVFYGPDPYVTPPIAQQATFSAEDNRITALLQRVEESNNWFVLKHEQQLARFEENANRMLQDMANMKLQIEETAKQTKQDLLHTTNNIPAQVQTVLRHQVPVPSLAPAFVPTSNFEPPSQALRESYRDPSMLHYPTRTSNALSRTSNIVPAVGQEPRTSKAPIRIRETTVVPPTTPDNSTTVDSAQKYKSRYPKPEDLPKYDGRESSNHTDWFNKLDAKIVHGHVPEGHIISLLPEILTDAARSWYHVRVTEPNLPETWQEWKQAIVDYFETPDWRKTIRNKLRDYTFPDKEPDPSTFCNEYFTLYRTLERPSRTSSDPPKEASKTEKPSKDTRTAEPTTRTSTATTRTEHEPPRQAKQKAYGPRLCHVCGSDKHLAAFHNEPHNIRAINAHDDATSEKETKIEDAESEDDNEPYHVNALYRTSSTESQESWSV